jgi:hypothetical protein
LQSLWPLCFLPLSAAPYWRPLPRFSYFLFFFSKSPRPIPKSICGQRQAKRPSPPCAKLELTAL